MSGFDHVSGKWTNESALFRKLKCQKAPPFRHFSCIMSNESFHQLVTEVNTIGILQTSWGFKTGETPEPYVTTDNRQRGLQLSYIAENKLMSPTLPFYPPPPPPSPPRGPPRRPSCPSPLPPSLPRDPRLPSSPILAGF